jgi:hypothetical protein
MGWYDMEDGGIYRCVDCYHEIWEGVCTSCNRRYPGHNYLDDDDDDIRFDDSDDDDEDDGGYDAHFRGGIGRFMEAIMNDSGLDDEDEEELELGLLEAQDLEEEIEAREVALRQLAEEQLGHWNHDREAVAMLNELVDEDDEHEAEDPDDYEEQLWHVRRYLGGDARIEEVDDDDEEGEEDSQYGGSFIDDQAVEEQANELAVNDERGSEDEVEFVEPPRQHNARRPAHRPLVVVESTDDEDESEAENSRALARQLGRGTTLGRPQPFMERRTRYVELSDDDEDHGGSDIHFSDSDGEPEAVENDSGLDYISEEEPDEAPITHTRIGRRRVVYEDSDS